MPFYSLAIGSSDFTMRWAGSDFFRNWRDTGKYSDPGWNLTGALAVAYKHSNGPRDASKYPNNEIYFNTGYSWSFRIDGVDPGGFDFWTVFLHETIHMLACDNQATHENEVMYPTIEIGARKYLQDSDRSILEKAGYVPEPGSWVLVGAGCNGPQSLPA